MNQVIFICSRYFKFWLLLELQDADKESQDKNIPEPRFFAIEQKHQLQLR